MHQEKKNKCPKEGLTCIKHKCVANRANSYEIQRPRESNYFIYYPQTIINRALLDLGGSINLLPFSVHQQLWLGDLHPTRVNIQLVDRSVKIPKGEITDVLIQVGKFIYPVDFIVLETQPVQNLKAQIPILDPSNCKSIINCRNGSMRLTFGDMTKEINVFHLGK